MARTKGLGAAKAYEEIKKGILAFRLLPHAPISENTMAQELGVSRTIIREALQKLEDDGLVERSGQRWLVTAMTEKDVYEICQVRAALESKAVEIILEKGGLSPAQIGNLREINIHSYQNKDHTLNYYLDDSFHDAICKYSGNSRLVAFYEKLHLQLERARWLTAVLSENDPREEHEQIIVALEKKNVRMAQNAVEAHLNTAQNNFVKIFSDENLWRTYNSLKSFISDE